MDDLIRTHMMLYDFDCLSVLVDFLYFITLFAIHNICVFVFVIFVIYGHFEIQRSLRRKWRHQLEPFPKRSLRKGTPFQGQGNLYMGSNGFGGDVLENGPIFFVLGTESGISESCFFPLHTPSFYNYSQPQKGLASVTWGLVRDDTSIQEYFYCLFPKGQGLYIQ